MIGRRSGPVTTGETGLRGFDSYDLRLGDIMRGERATLGKSLLDVQRDLKIKAAYISAIENADASAFESPGFIAGYVRSYARYLGLDPEWAFETFCDEAGFGGVNSAIQPQKPGAARAAPRKEAQAPRRAAAPEPLATMRTRFAPPEEGLLSRLQPAALGSVAVLVVLIGGLGYGAWAVFEEIQRVQFAPVEESPGVSATLDPLDLAMSAPDAEEGGLAPRAADRPGRLARPEALDLPVLVARDGPISAVDPDTFGALVPADPPRRTALARSAPDLSPEAAAPEDAVQVVADDRPPEVALVAVRPAWVRVSAQDGTILFEKILDAGERYVLPADAEGPRLRAGNSGSVYFLVDGAAYGPAGAGTSVARSVALGAGEITGAFALADLPEEFLPDARPSVAENAAAD
jgi:hypothetical protein